jgi:hypothetical protein
LQRKSLNVRSPANAIPFALAELCHQIAMRRNRANQKSPGWLARANQRRSTPSASRRATRRCVSAWRLPNATRVAFDRIKLDGEFIATTRLGLGPGNPPIGRREAGEAAAVHRESDQFRCCIPDPTRNCATPNTDALGRQASRDTGEFPAPDRNDAVLEPRRPPHRPLTRRTT